MKSNDPIHPAWELLALLSVLIAGVLILWHEPANLLTPAWVRRINAIGAWFQALGMILLAFEFLRRPLLKRQLNDYEIENLEASEEFKSALRAQDNRSKIKMIEAVLQKRADLEHRYSPMFMFPVTKRHAYIFGLALALFGYILQMSVA